MFMPVCCGGPWLPQVCKKLGGHLASIVSAAENDLIARGISAANSSVSVIVNVVVTTCNIML